MGRSGPIVSCSFRRTGYMRSGWFFAGLVCLAALCGACELEITTSQPTATSTPSPSIFTVRVTGSMEIAMQLPDGRTAPFAAPMKFSGHLLTRDGDGGSQSQSIEGSAPATYRVVGTSVSVNVQKQREEGSLKIEILRGDKVVKSSETTASYGVVSVSSQ